VAEKMDREEDAINGWEEVGDDDDDDDDDEEEASVRNKGKSPAKWSRVSRLISSSSSSIDTHNRSSIANRFE
jgi:hypothetical protein